MTDVPFEGTGGENLAAMTVATWPHYRYLVSRRDNTDDDPRTRVGVADTESLDCHSSQEVPEYALDLTLLHNRFA